MVLVYYADAMFIINFHYVIGVVNRRTLSAKQRLGILSVQKYNWRDKP
jgi:hypothetical protein